MALSERLKAQSTEVIGNELFIVGDVKTSFLTEGQFQALMGPEWVLADGRDVTGSEYATITGLVVVPDCRGRFMRMEGTGSAALRGLQAQTTAVNGLATASSSLSGSSGAGSASWASANMTSNTDTHWHNSLRKGVSNEGTKLELSSDSQFGITTDIGSIPYAIRRSTSTPNTLRSSNDAHSHTINKNTLNTNQNTHTHSTAGTAAAQALSGDTETRPDNVTCNYFIKIN